MKISAIILNYNSSEDCNKCIEYLKKQKIIQVEIIVVDNNSSNEDLLKIKDICNTKSCTFIQNDKNNGYSAGNNIGLKYSYENGYEFSLIINPDVEIIDEFYLYKLIEQPLKNKNIVLAASDIINLKNVHENPMYESNFLNELLSPFYKAKKPSYKKDSFSQKLSGCCFLIRLDFLKQINYLDENVFMYCEESILLSQIKRSNKLTFYNSSICAIHAHDFSKKGNRVKSLERYYLSREYYLKTYSNYSNIQIFILILSNKIQLFIKKIKYYLWQ